MTDPSTDPVGTVRDFPRYEEPSYSTYSAHCAVRWTDDRDEEYPWLLLGSEGPQRLSHDAVEGCRVIGAVPGTPAAEPDAADDEVAVERMARALHRGAWERDIANGTPLEGNDVDVCWSKVGAKYREWYYADARAALAALSGEQA